MDVVSDFKRTIEKNTANSMNILNKVYKKKEINSRKEFIREINKYYTGFRVLFQYTSGEEKHFVKYVFTIKLCNHWGYKINLFFI